jgi:hypothetical protein
MKRALLVSCGVFLFTLIKGQGFEVSAPLESYKGYIGEIIKAPIQLKNKSGKTITLIIRKAETQIGSTQKNFICPDGTCLGSSYVDDHIVKIEAGQSLQAFAVGLDAGLVPGQSRVRYIIYDRSNPNENYDLELNFLVEEKPKKADIYTSRFITIHDVYPNPVVEFATIDYRVHDERVQAKIVIHNILGSRMEEHELPFLHNQVKIKADQLSGGIYFYTLYIDNEGVLTHKLIVKR